MTVVAYSGNAGDNAIGLIACSRHQSASYLPWAQHKPRMDFINPVQGGRHWTGCERTSVSRRAAIRGRI